MVAPTLLVFVVLFAACCLTEAEPPTRLNLYRFFMGFGPEVNDVQKISFNPEAGLRFREQYEQKYGHHGELLIERFGKGLATGGPAAVDIDQILEPPKNKSKHFRTSDFSERKNKREINYGSSV